MTTTATQPGQVKTGSYVGQRAARIAVFALASALLAGEPYMGYEFAADPASIPFLAAMYIGLAITVESLTARFAWSPRVVMLFGVFVGVILEGFFTRTFYADEPRVLGVNWITVLIMALYWGVMATASARYAADRIRRRTWPVRTPGVWRAVGLAAWWSALLLVWGANLEPLTEVGAIPIAVLAVALLVLLAIVGRRREGALDSTWPRSRLLDVALVTYVVVGLLVGIAVPILPIRVAIWIVVGLVIGITGLIVLGRRPAGVQQPVYGDTQ